MRNGRTTRISMKCEFSGEGLSLFLSFSVPLSLPRSVSLVIENGCIIIGCLWLSHCRAGIRLTRLAGSYFRAI